MRSLIESIDRFLLEKTRFKKEKGHDPERGLEKLAKWTDKPDIGLHFSDLNKVGVNPASGYSTPMGVYAYLFDREWFDVVRKGEVPFAGKRDYLHLIQVNRKNFVVIQPSGRTPNYGKRRYEKDIALLKKNYGHIPKAGWDVFLNTEERKRAGTKFGTTFGTIWGITARLGELSGGNSITQWTKILLSLGIDGVIDLGYGIIHKNEPRQMVVLNPRTYKRVLTVTKDEVARSRTAGVADDPEIKLLEERLESFFKTATKMLSGVEAWQLPYKNLTEIKKLTKDYEKIAEYWGSIWSDIEKLADFKGEGSWGMTSEAGNWSPKKHIAKVYKGLQGKYRGKHTFGLGSYHMDEQGQALKSVIEGLRDIPVWEAGFDKALAKKDMKKAIEYIKNAPRSGSSLLTGDRMVSVVRKGLEELAETILDGLIDAEPQVVTDKIKEITTAVAQWGFREVTDAVNRTINRFMDRYEKRAA